MTFWITLFHLIVVIFKISAAQNRILLASATEFGSTGWTVTLSWLLPRSYPSMEVSWAAVIYASEPFHQMNYRSLETINVSDPTNPSFGLQSQLKYDQQYQFCIHGSDSECSQQIDACVFTKVSRPKKLDQGPHRYLIIGPVDSRNLTASWKLLKNSQQDKSVSKNGISYHLSWKRIDGRVNGHPGHSSNVVSDTHYIKGLQPATRYEICVVESLKSEEQETCDIINTKDDVPGPPESDSCTCYSQARGTHWRCEIVWKAPKKPNGKIKGYSILWKDEDEFSLLETVPTGALCDPFCVNDQILPFHPSEVCVKARTSQGSGWESCVKVEDVSERILAFFELKVVLVILSTLFMYIFGLSMIRFCFKCSVRSLYGAMEKQHPV